MPATKKVVDPVVTKKVIDPAPKKIKKVRRLRRSSANIIHDANPAVPVPPHRAPPFCVKLILCLENLLVDIACALGGISAY